MRASDLERQAPANSASGSAPESDRAGLNREMRQLTERVAALERGWKESDLKTARLAERIVGLLCDYLEPGFAPSSEVEGGESGAVARAEKVLETGSFQRVQTQSDSAAFAKLAAALAHMDKPARTPASGEFKDEDSGRIKSKPARLDTLNEARLPDAPPEIAVPPQEETDWNAWGTTWVLAEQRAELLGVKNVPPFSSMLFSPGGGQAALDAWRSLYAGREVLREAAAAEIADEQIRQLIGATLQKYESELEAQRKSSPWHGILQRLRDSLRVLGSIATSETQADVIKGGDCLEAWIPFMDENACWASGALGYDEKTAQCICLLYDKLADRPGSRQSQFSIETKADMITYNVLRACEVFLAQMNVQRDKELSVGKLHEHLQNLKLRDQQVPFRNTPPGGAKPAGALKIARILRNRWVLNDADGREQSELSKPSYELE